MPKPRAGSGAQATAFSSRFPAKPLDQPDGNAAAPERLRRRADFLRAAKGMRFVARGLTLQAAPRPIPPEMEARAPTDQTGNPPDVPHCSEAQPRFGFTVTKQSGGAVQRNRILRRVKEALRLLDPLPTRPGHDYVILARPEALGMPFLALQEELIRALGKIAARKYQPPIHRDDERVGRAGDSDEVRRRNSKRRNPK
jgi:ribonuclease P protein component